MTLGVLGSFQSTAFIFSLDQGRKSNLVGDYRGDEVCILSWNSEEGAALTGGAVANTRPSNAHLRHTLAWRTLASPSPVNGKFDTSIFENGLMTAAVQGEVMWVTSAPVNWATLEPPPEELELMPND